PHIALPSADRREIREPFVGWTAGHVRAPQPPVRAIALRGQSSPAASVQRRVGLWRIRRCSIACTPDDTEARGHSCVLLQQTPYQRFGPGHDPADVTWNTTLQIG